MLTLFVVFVLAYHALGLIGSIDQSLIKRTQPWAMVGLVWHVVLLVWGGWLLWLMR